MDRNSFAVIAITNNIKTKKVEILVQGVEGTQALAIAQKLIAEAQLESFPQASQGFEVTDPANPENNQRSIPRTEDRSIPILHTSAGAFVQEVSPVPPLAPTEIRTPLCKRCGRIMIKKTNKTTKQTFYGCPSFPNCRYTINEDELTTNADGTPKPTLSTYTLDNPDPRIAGRAQLPPKKPAPTLPTRRVIPELYPPVSPDMDVEPPF